MSEYAVGHRPNRVLADLLPVRRHGLLADVTLVALGTLFIAAFAQLVVPLPFTPVPLSLGTFAVLFTGASLGPVRGFASVLCYVAAGVFGAPVFAHAASGWHLPTFGYIVGYLPAALLLGALTRRGADRSPMSLFGGVAAASAVLYLFGVPWLMASTGMDLSQGLAKGMMPFVIGDAIKALVIAVILPTTWRLVDRRENRDD